MNWRKLQNAFDYDPQGGEQDLQATFACGDGGTVSYYLFVRRRPFRLELVRIGEVDEPGVDRTVNLGTHKAWRGVADVLQADLARLGCV